jgi:transcriptional regulator with XRE-family HTH domain
MSYFGKNIKKIRKLQGMSQLEFGLLFDLKRATLGAYEEGRSEPKIETLIKVANHFSIAIDKLLTQDLSINELLNFRTDLTGEAHSIETKMLSKIPLISHANLGKLKPDTFKKDDFTLQIALPSLSDQEYYAFEVLDVAMSQNNHGVFPKDLVIGSVTEIDTLNISDWYVWILEDRYLIRKFVAITDGEIQIQAIHRGMPVEQIAITEVHRIFRVRSIVRHNFSYGETELETRLHQLESLIKEAPSPKKTPTHK